MIKFAYSCCCTAHCKESKSTEIAISNLLATTWNKIRHKNMIFLMQYMVTEIDSKLDCSLVDATKILQTALNCFFVLMFHTRTKVEYCKWHFVQYQIIIIHTLMHTTSPIFNTISINMQNCTPYWWYTFR